MWIQDMEQLNIYSDGASRGNPGPSAAAVKITDARGVAVKRFSKFLGRKTNNQAEYEALIVALEQARQLTDKSVECFLDSELVVKQLRGEYRIKNPRLRSLWQKILDIQQYFQNVSFNYVSRLDENIAEVDRMANRVLDSVLGEKC